MKKTCLFLLALLVKLCPLPAQEQWVHQPQNYRLTIEKTSQRMAIDGKLDEAIWQTAAAAENFWMKFPADNEKASLPTRVQMCYDDRFLYIAAVCYDSSQRYLVQSLKRDQGLRLGDGFGVVLDPFNQKTNGFFFAVSAFNSQSEDLLTNNNADIDFSWDNKWFSETKIYPDYWVAEIAIPFNILRFDANRLTWGINFIRSNRKKNEFHSWTRVPVQFPPLDLGYMGLLQWPQVPPRSSSANISVNPYVSSAVITDKEYKKDPELRLNTGFDAKLAVTPSLNLDLTVNPDFSQVDVDRQVTNLSRFSIFFPERRVFFLENNDLFSAYGVGPVQPFYSRRIGSKNGQTVPILFGARLSGHVSPKTRLGIMNIQTGKQNGQTADNFTAVSVNQRVLERSSIGAYFLNRQGFLTEEQRKYNPLDAYGRNAGVELEYTSKSGNWNGWYGHHNSMKPGITDKNNFINFGSQYSGRNFGMSLDFGLLGQNYYADMGFENFITNVDDERDTLVRLGTQYMYNDITYSHFPTSKSPFNQLVARSENYWQFTPDGLPYEQYNILALSANYRSTAAFTASIDHRTSHLRFPYRFTAGDPLPAGTYQYTQFGVGYNTDLRKDFSLQLSAKAGQFYNAGYRQLKTVLHVRKQPRFNVGLTAEYNLLDFPALYGREEILLVAPSFEYNFSNKLFWTTFLQLNTQNNNINVNSRLQWRFRPMSDLFIVYTDNYYTDPLLHNKNRGFVCKVNYWLNW